jgi:hypothetical protein
MTQEYMTPDETDRYIDERIRRAMHPKRGIVGRVWGLITGLIWLVLIGLVIAVFAFAARVQYGLPIPLPQSLVSTAAVTFSTAAAPLPTARQVPVGGAQPVPAQPAFVDHGAAPWPTLTPTAEEATDTPALTSNTQLTAIAVKFAPTETAQAVEWRALSANDYQYFYDPYTLQTPETGFVEGVKEKCRDPEKVKASATLQLFCGGGE